MKSSSIKIILLIGLLLTPSIANAQELQKYSFFSRLIDGFRLFFSQGESRVDLLLEIKEKEINSAIVNAGEGNFNEAIRSLDNAKNNMQSVQGLINLNNTQKITSSVNKTINQLIKIDLPKEFNDYLIDEQVTGSSAELISKTYKYCKELALKDYNLMLSDELCNSNTASDIIKSELKNLEQSHNESISRITSTINECVNNPSECDCSHLTGIEQINCNEVASLALKCEYQDDETSCSKLRAEGFNIITNQTMINNETSEPSMKDSIPQCYDAQGNFLNHCGKVIRVIRNGLVNYLIEQELNQTIETLIDNTIDVNGLINQTKQEIIELNNTIATRTFAPGTWETNNTEVLNGTGNLTNDTVIVEGNNTSDSNPEISNVVIEGNGTGDLTPEISNVVIEGNGTGNVTPEISNVVIETN
ncbi:MAG TPA: hypothetical protein VI790_05090 [Candidatus Nanoarchaeia archaeon]|nr:hypothetical protein [Candidatus Nanoarchaeia archaeon]